jgi:hypothetical protein
MYSDEFGERPLTDGMFENLRLRPAPGTPVRPPDRRGHPAWRSRPSRWPSCRRPRCGCGWTLMAVRMPTKRTAGVRNSTCRLVASFGSGTSSARRTTARYRTCARSCGPYRSLPRTRLWWSVPARPLFRSHAEAAAWWGAYRCGGCRGVRHPATAGRRPGNGDFIRHDGARADPGRPTGRDLRTHGQRWLATTLERVLRALPAA